MTIAYGHGVPTTPLQTAVAGAALVNGGYLIEPTFLPRTRAEADKVAVKVVKDSTVRDMRKLFRDNVVESVARASRPACRASMSEARQVRLKSSSAAAMSTAITSTRFFCLPDELIRSMLFSVFIDDPRTGEHNSNLAGNTATPWSAALLRALRLFLVFSRNLAQMDRQRSFLIKIDAIPFKMDQSRFDASG